MTQTAANLHVVETKLPLEKKLERIKRLLDEAQALSSEATSQFIRDIEALAADAALIAETKDGSGFKVGIREIARRMAEDLTITSQSIQAIDTRK